MVIPARNDAAGLPGAVATSLAQTGVDVLEVLICVGPSQDDTERVARELEAMHDIVAVLENRAGGISEALNLGLDSASGDVLVRVDARCRLAPDHVARALAVLFETGAANVGAVQAPVGHTLLQRAIARALQHRLGSGGAAYRVGAERKRVDTAFLGVFRTDVLREVGGWDVTFRRNEDAELNQRLRSAGHDVWLEPGLRVGYEPRSTLRGLARQFFDYGWWRRRMIARHGVVAVRQLVPPMVVVAIGGSVVLALSTTPYFLVVPLGYLALLVVASVVDRAELTRFERALLPLAWATMHLAWGTGFLASLMRGPWRIPPFEAAVFEAAAFEAADDRAPR